MTKAKIQSFIHKPSSTICYLVSDPSTGKAAIIDSVLDFFPDTCTTNTDFIDNVLKEADGLDVTHILETHCHADHLSASQYIKKKYPNAVLAISKNITKTQKTFQGIYGLTTMLTDGSQFDMLLSDGDEFCIGKLPVKALYTPGHTLDSMSYVIGGDAVFVGDTLFMEDSGTARCDFPNGSAEMLYSSIRRILALPDETRIFLCHDYGCNGTREIQYETTVGKQKAHNIHVKDGNTVEQYVQLRTERDAKLAFPGLIIPSVQFNAQGGQPNKDGDDESKLFLKYPMNATSYFSSSHKLYY